MKTQCHEQEEIPKGYDRVTDVLSPYKSFDGVDRTVLANAAARGALVHTFCELYALNLLIETPPDHVKPYFESFKLWFDTWVDKVVVAELRINDPEFRISGKFDMICKLKYSDNLVLVDYKTPLTYDKTWEMQLAAYRLLVHRNTNMRVDRTLCLKLDSEGKEATHREYRDFEMNEKLFVNQLEIFRFFNRKLNLK